MIGDRRFF